jgi:hypothetical protein
VRSLLRTVTFATAAGLAAVVLYLVISAPPRAIALPGDLPPTQVTGAYHIHTSRSDGTGTADEVAAAAARAGLSFIILTDHDDATRPPDPPTYRHGVLCIDAVEINTTGGHVVALGLTGTAPYPLAGHPRDVVEDIHRLGGYAVIAHPDSPNPELRWRGQNVAFDGIEWLNVDSEWRDETPRTLLAAGARSFVRGPETIASLFSRPARTFDRWDTAARRRPVFGLVALDAHANIGWRDREEPRQRTALARPTYEALFRTAAQSVLLDAPLSGQPGDDATRIVGALAAGASFSIIRAFAGPASLEFTAEQGSHRATIGGRLTADAPTTIFRVAVPQAPGARITLVADGQPLRSGQGSLVLSTQTRPGVYRVEVGLPGASAPWIVSNPIGIGAWAPTLPGGTEPPPEPEDVLRLPMTPTPWTIERDPASSAQLSQDGAELRFGFALAPGQPRGQYAALVTDVGTASGVDRVQFTARAAAPLRLSLQVRLPGAGEGQRWRRSVYLDTTPRQVTVDLQEFEAVERSTSQQPIVAPVRTLLFVVDTLNSRTGSEGVFWISDVALGLKQP